VNPEGEIMEPRVCNAVVSQDVWRSEEICMNQIIIEFNRSLGSPQKKYAIRDYECFEWKRQRHPASKSKL